MSGGNWKELFNAGCAGDLALVRNDRTNWHFSSGVCLVSLTQRLTHEIGIAVKINHWCFVDHAQAIT